MSTRLALIIAALVGGYTFAAAQDSFPDVPKNHWAYKAVTTLKSEGLLKGYPDGLFRGQRSASRYELAVSLYAWWSTAREALQSDRMTVEDILKRLDAPRTRPDIPNMFFAIRQLEGSSKDQTAPIKSIHSDLEELRRQLDSLKSEVSVLNDQANRLKKATGQAKSSG